MLPEFLNVEKHLMDILRHTLDMFNYVYYGPKLKQKRFGRYEESLDI